MWLNAIHLIAVDFEKQFNKRIFYDLFINYF